MGNIIKKGDIISGSYGYDACLTRFYRVITRTEKTVTLVQLRTVAIGPCSYEGYEVVPGDEVGEPFRKKVKAGSYWGEYVDITSYMSAFPWDGEPELNYNWH